MHRSRAQSIALICLLIIGGGLIYGVFGYRNAVLRLANERAELAKNSKVRVDIPAETVAERYIPPAPITFPFF